MNNLENAYSAKLNQQKALSEKFKKNPISDAANIPKKLSEHWIILGIAILFDIVGLIPFVGIIANPLFGLALYLYLKIKTDSSNLGFKIGGGTAVGVIIESVPIINLLPTNLANALIAILTKT